MRTLPVLFVFSLACLIVTLEKIRKGTGSMSARKCDRILTNCQYTDSVLLVYCQYVREMWHSVSYPTFGLKRQEAVITVVSKTLQNNRLTYGHESAALSLKSLA
jgi:hypothetical protein